MSTQSLLARLGKLEAHKPIARFPAGMADADIEAVMRREYPAPARDPYAAFSSPVSDPYAAFSSPVTTARPASALDVPMPSAADLAAQGLGTRQSMGGEAAGLGAGVRSLATGVPFMDRLAAALGNGLMEAMSIGATAANPLLGIAPVAGIASKAFADRATQSNVRQLAQTILAGGNRPVTRTTGLNSPANLKAAGLAAALAGHRKRAEAPMHGD